jgi:hypothetical protein
MGSALQADIARDTGSALREWWQAVRELPLNPLYQLGAREAPKKKRGSTAVGWSVLLVALIGSAYFAVPVLYGFLDHALWPGLTVALGVAAWLLLWMGYGLFEAAVFTLRILADKRLQRGAELELDAGMLTAPISDREITVALVALVLPRIWIRWSVAPLATLASWTLLGLLRNPDTIWIEMPTAITARFPMPSLTELGHWLPFSYIAMQFFGLIASVVFILWLLALGRGLAQNWHIYLMSLSDTLMQLAWIPASLIVLSNWMHLRTDIGERGDGAVRFFAMLLLIALTVATLALSRRIPALRIAISAIVPPLALVAALIGLTRLDMYAVGPRNAFGEFLWAFSAGMLANPLALTNPHLLGFGQMGFAYWLFAPWRMPLLLILQLLVLAICAHGARVAVEDWRRGES